MVAFIFKLMGGDPGRGFPTDLSMVASTPERAGRSGCRGFPTDLSMVA